MNAPKLCPRNSTDSALPIDGKHSSGSEYRNSRPPSGPQNREQDLAQGPVIFMKPQISTPSPHDTDGLTFCTRDDDLEGAFGAWRRGAAASSPPVRRTFTEGPRNGRDALSRAAHGDDPRRSSTGRDVSQQLPAVRGTKGSGCFPTVETRFRRRAVDSSYKAI